MRFRNEAYGCVTRSLEVLLNQILNPATMSVPSRPGPPIASDVNTMTGDAAQNHVSAAPFFWI